MLSSGTLCLGCNGVLREYTVNQRSKSHSSTPADLELNNRTVGSARVIPSLLLKSQNKSLDHHPQKLRQSLSQSPELGRHRLQTEVKLGVLGPSSGSGPSWTLVMQDMNLWTLTCSTKKAGCTI